MTADTATPSRPRGARKEAIVVAAAKLFAAQGYPATGIDEIGAAAGISGPGVYRHFAGKNALLSEVIRRALAEVVSGVDDVVGSSDDPWVVLDALVQNLARSVLADRAAWAVLVRERRHLDPATARTLGRAHRLHVEEWVHALAQARPDLSDGDVRVMVHGVIGMAAPFAARYDSGLDADHVVALLTEIGLRMLRLGRAS
jgi:AcrR family transcriptional regulator